MNRKNDANSIEELIIKSFNYMAELNKRIRGLKFKIKQQQEFLDVELKDNKEYIDIMTSINTGKGKYHNISMLPIELKNQMESYKKLSEEEKALLQQEYELALVQEKNLAERYKQLSDDYKSRNERIKHYKRVIADSKKELKLKEKEYNDNLLKVKSLDKKLGKLPNIQKGNDENKLVYKQNNQ